MSVSKHTLQAQTDMVNYCRQAQGSLHHYSRPDAMPHYRKLIRNLHHDVLQSAYPLAHELLGTNWDTAIDQFLASASTSQAQLWRMPQSFMHWVSQTHKGKVWQLPQLNNLLLFEWTEIELQTMPNKSLPPYKPNGNLQTDKLVITPEYSLLPLEYPVHQLPASEAVARPGKYFVLGFRHSQSGDVEFVALTALHVFVIEKLGQQPYNLNELSTQAALVFAMHNTELVRRSLHTFFATLHELGFVLGFSIS